MKKVFPISLEKVKQIIKQIPTPFYIYDEKAIRDNLRNFINAFSWAPSFREYFAVKATPNPHLLKLLNKEGAGADCSSLPELILAEKTGILGDMIMFSSNDTPIDEFKKALSLKAIINLDDLTHLNFLEKYASLPEILSFRYNPGDISKSNALIGKPKEAKYGLTKKQLFEGYKRAKEKNIKRFGLHTMVVSNELSSNAFLETAEMMFNLAVELKNQLDIEVEFINLGGGIGIPYLPDEKPADIKEISQKIKSAYEKILLPANLNNVRLAFESGRLITGPYGYLVSTVIHEKNTYKNYIGLDANMANLMRPGMYGAYHHLEILGKENLPHNYIYDVTGSLCENCDKFAINRPLPKIEIGDIAVIFDAGAHGHSMGFNYNGKLRCAELLLKENGDLKMIRRAETIDDYFATLRGFENSLL